MNNDDNTPTHSTMAELVALRTALTRIGFTAAVASFIMDTQGMNDLEEFLLLDDEGVGTLCRAIRRPGGQIPNPAFAAAGTAAAAAAARIPANISNPGYVVSTHAETNLKLMCYFLLYHRSTSCDTEATVITLDAVWSMKTHKDWESNHVDVEAPELNDKDLARTFEAIDEWLHGCLGEFSKILLAYVVQDNKAVTADPVAPATWPSKVDEMISRAPHGEDTFFPADNVTVWEKISTLTHSHECWTYVRPAQRTRNGRMAYRALKNHYLSPNNTNHQTNKAEAKLKDSSHHGKKHHWNFEKYVHMHQDQHTILPSLVQHGYVGIDECSKVRHLLDGIKTNKLDTAKGQIWAPPLLQNNFDDCVTLFQDFINNKRTATMRTSTFASIGTKRKPDDINEHDTEPNMSVDDQYYTGREYAKLSKAKKLGLKLKCQMHGHNPGNKGNKGNKGRPRPTPKSTSDDHATTCIIKALSRLIAEGGPEEDDATSEMDHTDHTGNDTNASNQANKAFQRCK